MIIKDIQQHIISEGIENILRSEAPLNVEDIVWIVESPSPPPNPSIGYYEANLDFWARYAVTQDARDVLESIFDLLHRKVSWETTNHHIYLSASNSLIEDFDRDIEDRKLLRLSMRFIYRDKNE